jgi:ribosome maturation factor RimP
MIQRNQIIQLAESFLKGTENYLIDVKVSSTNRISVLIENDQHVSIQDCIALSRHIEHSLDREKEDFELEVSSPGIDQPFKHIRQYVKYAGQAVELKMKDGRKVTGILVSADEKSVHIQPDIPKKTKKNPNPELGISPVYALDEILETRLIIKI